MNRFSSPANQSARCPTPDLLSAFAANALSPGERKTLLDHLAGCKTCRACVSFIGEAPQSRQWPRFATHAAAILILPALGFALLSLHRAGKPPHLPLSSASQTPSLLQPAEFLTNSLSTRRLTQAERAFHLLTQSHLSSSLAFYRKPNGPRLVLQTERGERWIAVGSPFSESKRN